MDEPQREPTFSLNEFRYWLNKNKDSKPKRKKSIKVNTGEKNIKVESRLGISRLSKKILEHNVSTLDENKANELAEEFKQEGAVILMVEDLMATIQVGDIQFYLPKMYTKKVIVNND